ncbi:acetyl-CoA carboxylase biotin carboxylase subunit [Heyndrickxia sp. FSL K6-6286]|uniref:acetyl-CoA carboxylase biotin carboxylase subunit n=1 Tax=Heyndrickxia sp. FSL K6-6286 TaxID=2921510 RepID=UPI00315AA1F5
MKKILIANRGEIALRIIKTCKQMGIETVAVFSDADSSMPFVKAADYSYRIGEAPVNKSYLNMDEIIKIALQEKVDGIHPGYGLLSENSQFSSKVQKSGIKFIGPSSETIEKMGDKINARKLMKEAGVPIVPGSVNGVKTLQEAQKLAKDIGYPIMLKASGGGGGIGMVRCEDEQALNQHYESTKNRSKASFGSEDVFIEKCIDCARHIEVQIVGDQYGDIIHLYERNCSVQRRNQKVIEEAPSPNLSKSTQKEMYAAALKAARAVKYENVGTVEFIVDNDENFYFLEMNTRLQVEHPVTEMLTNIDLVKWQILIAQGEKLPLSQAEIDMRGHAIELRIYAEDPKTFYPSPGLITQLSWGEVEGVRIDAGYSEGLQVTPFYDPMLAKCIIFAADRDSCILKAKEFLLKTSIEGIKTNIPYLIQVLDDHNFQSGQYTTELVNKMRA